MSGLSNINFTSWLRFDNDTQLVSVRFEEDSDGANVIFSYLVISRLTIQFKICQLTFMRSFSAFELEHCNDYMNLQINLSKILEYSSRLQVEQLIGYNVTAYWIYSPVSKKMFVCTEDNQCFEKTPSPPLRHEIDQIVVVPKVLEVLVLSEGVFRAYDIGGLKDPEMKLLMEVDESKVIRSPRKGHYSSGQSIDSFATDSQFRSLLILQTSSSSIFIIQKERPENSSDLCLWHVTSFIESPESCPTFLDFLMVSDGDSKPKIVVICKTRWSTFEVIEYVIENPFYVRNSRQYPLFDYTVVEEGKHFCD